MQTSRLNFHSSTSFRVNFSNSHYMRLQISHIYTNLLFPTADVTEDTHTHYASTSCFTFSVQLYFRPPPGTLGPKGSRAFSFLRFLDHTQRRITVGRTSLDEWSARRRNLYLTTHNTHNRQTYMPTARFEPIISAGQRPQTHALDRAAGHWDRHCATALINE
jgi:hypothetical protein